MGTGQPCYITLWLGPWGGRAGEQVLSPSLATNSENLSLEPSLGVAQHGGSHSSGGGLGSTLKVKEASLADADGAQASPRRGAVSPIPQLLPPTEGDPWGWGVSGGSWEDALPP